MARQHVLRDVHGKGLKMTKAWKPGPDGHFLEASPEDPELSMREDMDDDSVDEEVVEVQVQPEEPKVEVKSIPVEEEKVVVPPTPKKRGFQRKKVDVTA